VLLGALVFNQVIMMTASQRTHRWTAGWRPLRRAAAALRALHWEQTIMWGVWWQADGAAVPSSGPLTWILTPDGYRLSGRHLPAAGDTGTGDRP
jgi:hypothetical protein